MGVSAVQSAEVWKPIRDFPDSYEISDLGNVRSTKTGHCRSIKPKHNKRAGYWYVNLQEQGRKRTASLHRLVAENFLNNPHSYPCVNHIDEDKSNNAANNLEWCTYEHNTKHSSYRWRKKVNVFSVDGEKLATFTSERAAAEVLWLSKTSIAQAIKKGCTAGCFVVRYAKEES